jgi:hypothetical protein
MRQLGMEVEIQSGPLPERSVRKLRERGKLNAATAMNLIGLLPGADRRAPPVLMMAHYDSVVASPGAPDDAAGVAAALEIVRAIKARGLPARDVAILFTDAEEVGLVGARLFFAGHQLAPRIGAVINMESRGGAGAPPCSKRGAATAPSWSFYRRAVTRPSANSLAVLVYELMPNNTDFTIPKEKGIAGFNFAFIGRGELYHSPAGDARSARPWDAAGSGRAGAGRNLSARLYAVAAAQGRGCCVWRRARAVRDRLSARVRLGRARGRGGLVRIRVDEGAPALRTGAGGCAWRSRLWPGLPAPHGAAS